MATVARRPSSGSADAASQTAGAFGYHAYEWRRIRGLTTGARRPGPVPMAMRARGAAATATSEVPPEAGMATVEVGIEGSIGLTR